MAKRHNITFDTVAQYNTFKASENYVEPNVSYIKETNGVVYNPKPDYSKRYLTFVAKENGTFKFSKSINYSLDSGTTWTELASNTNTPTVTAGSKILWKANLTPNSNGIGEFSSTNNFTAEGNVMSLLYSDDFVGQTSLSEKDYAFYGLFFECTRMTSAENLSLPATTLADDCYNKMFYSCYSLTTAPSLPATTLEYGCYSYMFQNCINLTTAPSLPATTLANYCYLGMFRNCINLTTAPSLPATTLANFCYSNMFNDCTNLTTAPSLPATTLADYCYYYMFQGCSNLTTAPSLPATALTIGCYQYMFNGCTNLTTAPSVLPATTLEYGCYSNMFNDCTSLTTAPNLPATTLANSCYNGMFQGCSNLTTAPSLPATALTIGCYEYMFYGCTNLNYIKAMFTTTPSASYMSNWVNGVASSGMFVKNSAATWTSSCGESTYPCNWTVETASN